MSKLLLSALLLFIVFVADAQVRRITGMVTYNGDRLNGVLIKNISENIHAISDERGGFTISAQTGDTIITSGEYFINDTLLVADNRDLIIQLHKNPLMLKEVVINGKAVTPASTYEENKKEYKDIYVKGDKSHIVSVSVGLTPGIAINIDKVYNALSKQGKDARKMQRTLTKDYKNSIVDKRFNPIAAKITGYKGEQLNDFVLNNRPSYEMVIKASDYDIARYIKAKMNKEEGK